MKSLLVGALASVVLSCCAMPVTAVELNFTTFDGTEPTSDGNVAGYVAAGGSGFDTVNGWTWGNILGGGGAPGQGVFFGLQGGNIVDRELTVPNDIFHDFIGVGSITKNPEDLWFDIGNSAHPAGLAQAFTVTPNQQIDITYGIHAGTGTPGGALLGMNIYVDNGDGIYVKAHTMIDTNNDVPGQGPDDPATQYQWLVTSLFPETFSFTPVGANIRIAIVGNDEGYDSNGRLEFLDVSQVPEPASVVLMGLGGLAMLVRRRKR